MTGTGEALVADALVSGPPPTVRPDETVHGAWLRMRERRLTVVAVVDDERCLGLLEVHALWAAWALDLAAHRTVAHLVSPTACVRGDAPLAELCRALTGSPHQAVLVTDGEDRLQGVVTAADVVAALAGS